MGKKLAEAEQDLAPFKVLSLGLETAKTGARLGELARRGEVIGVNDAYVAATALRKGLKLLTRDGSDFKRVEGPEECSMVAGGGGRSPSGAECRSQKVGRSSNVGQNIFVLH